MASIYIYRVYRDCIQWGGITMEIRLIYVYDKIFIYETCNLIDGQKDMSV